jgi:hypothetical protein
MARMFCQTLSFFRGAQELPASFSEFLAMTADPKYGKTAPISIAIIRRPFSSIGKRMSLAYPYSTSPIPLRVQASRDSNPKGFKSTLFP